MEKVLIACDSSHTLLGFRGKLIEELVKCNQVHVFTPKILQKSVADTLKKLNVVVHENDLKGSNVSVLSDLKYIASLYKLIKTVKPDIFFPYTFKPIIYGTLISKLCRVKRITPMLTGLGYNFTDSQTKKNLVSKITKMLLKFSLAANKRVDIIFQNPDDCKKLLVEKIINLKHKVHVVNGSGVDLTDYVYSEPETAHISFLMISRLINAKGIKEFYEAAKLVKQNFPDAKFKLIGSYDDNIDAIGEELYQKIKLGDIIEYMGEVNDVKTYIKESSVVVLPSYYGEGVPRCLLEGMAMGRPIITCNSTGCRETVTDLPGEKNGFLIPVKDISALANSMKYYLSNTMDIILNGRNGRVLAQQKFDVNLVNAQMLKIMQVAS
ncbi:N,N'-diacetylbacillosaminyl-diphospho-undecaprenol alpha-1,3-N-acetylgalactosaminyltransferase [compost metagenome]|uniref:glycosyltransferase family 4 protein n=1 Tax=Pedobacter ghigonis TaxID=2730403 RepID=UPI000FBE0BB6|nr:glycosyltransferase family 4 protein [Pedobacter ghigonis]